MAKENKPLRQLATEKLHGKGSNPSQLGDPISLKAESADSSPTDNDRGAAGQYAAKVSESFGGSHEEKMLKDGKKLRGIKDDSKDGKVEENKTMMGDPTSLKSETSGTEGLGDNGPSGKGKGGKSKL